MCFVQYHDMFQSGYARTATPALGIPGAEFNPFHKPVFQHLCELVPVEVREA